MKAKNKYIKDCGKNKEYPYLNYWDWNTLYVWAMSQNFTVGVFKWVEDTSKFSNVFIENYQGNGDEGNFSETYV